MRQDDAKEAEMIMVKFATLHTLRRVLDWHSIDMTLEEYEDDHGNVFDILIFEDWEEDIMPLRLPSPLGKRMFAEFMDYLTVVPQEEDEEDGE